MDVDNPKVLRKLKIDEFSLVDVPASVGSDVLIWKRDEGHLAPSQPKATKSAAELETEIAKLEARITTLKANGAVDEVMALLAKRDPASTAAAGAILRSSPEVYDAYFARTRGEPYEMPVRKVEDTRSSIERSIAEGQAKLAALAKAATAPKVDEPALAEAKGRLRGIFDKLKSRKDAQVAEARAELAELLGSPEGRAAVYDMAVIGHLAAAA